MFLAQVGELVSECGQLLGVLAVAGGDARFLVALAPLGRGLQERVQLGEAAVPVAEDGLYDCVQLGGRTDSVEVTGGV
ncbi:hypothetical protein ACFWR9_08440 [Streptomyces sp. NPDC058534]|uniref:hypothetical protein n=1 Tax=Streptomyces sp. NPDC058534 TaxID=3346541 RepID=UPI00365BD3F4